MVSVGTRYYHCCYQQW